MRLNVDKVTHVACDFTLRELDDAPDIVNNVSRNETAGGAKCVKVDFDTSLAMTVPGSIERFGERCTVTRSPAA